MNRPIRPAGTPNAARGSALRPLTLGEVLDVSFGLYRRLFAALLMVTLITQSLPMALNVYMEAAGGILSHLLLYVFTLVLSIVLGSVGTAASTFLISEQYLGRVLSPEAALRRAAPFITRVTVVSLLMTLAVSVGIVMLFVPGLVLLSGLVLATPALVIEDIGNGVDPLGRSWRLTRGFRGKIFGAIMTLGVLFLIPAIGVGMLSGLLGGLGETVANLVRVVLIAVLQVLAMPLFYCTLTVAYYDLRVRKEGFDLQRLAAGIASR